MEHSPFTANTIGGALKTGAGLCFFMSIFDEFSGLFHYVFILPEKPGNSL